MTSRLLLKCHALDLKEFGIPILEDVWEAGNGYRWGHMQYHAHCPTNSSIHLTKTGQFFLFAFKFFEILDGNFR
jgi:hypothetical protein